MGLHIVNKQQKGCDFYSQPFTQAIILLLKRSDILLVKDYLTLGSVQMVDSIAVEFLYLSAHHLHSTVHHTVLLGECLGKYSKCAGQPSLGEHTLEVAALLEALNVGLDKFDTGLAALIGCKVEVLGS